MATKEQIYTAQMIELGIYEKAFDPEIKMLARLERELTRAQKEWSKTAQDGGAPSFTEPIYPTIQRLRQEILAHREALGLTPKALRKLRGQPAEGPSQQEQITTKLDLIAQRVSEYDNYHPGLAGPDGDLTLAQYMRKYSVPGEYNGETDVEILDKLRGAAALAGYEDLPDAQDAIRISERLDAELKHAVAEDMG